MVCIKALRIFATKISYNHLIFNIMSECKTVTLRTRPLKKGMLSFYLDYYPGYRDQETMKTIRHEGLNIYIYANPKNQRERDFNAAMSEKAEAIRCRRFEAIVNERYDFFGKFREIPSDFELLEIPHFAPVLIEKTKQNKTTISNNLKNSMMSFRDLLKSGTNPTLQSN